MQDGVACAYHCTVPVCFFSTSEKKLGVETGNDATVVL